MDYRNIQKTIYKVSDFLSFQRNKSLVLSPSFQRRPVWLKPAKSYLIDTVVQGLPIPIIFLREQTNIQTLEPIREVVDGQQRLRTLISYIDPILLKDFDPKKDEFVVSKSHNSEIAGKKYPDLDPRIRLRILNYQFSVHILPSDTDDREVLQIFARMNSTGVKLNPQEIRNAKYFGLFKKVCYELAYEQLNRWRKWNIFTENNMARMDEVEETSDLIRIMIEGLKGRSQTAINRLYDRYEDNFDCVEEVKKKFRIVMDKIDDIFGENLDTSEFSRKALFNTLFAVFYDELFRLNSPLTMKKHGDISKSKMKHTLLVASERIKQKKIHEDLLKVLRGATGNLESRKIRFEFVKSILNNAKAS